MTVNLNFKVVLRMSILNIILVSIKHLHIIKVFWSYVPFLQGISPKLEFCTKTVIKESRSPELDALEDALEEEKVSQAILVYCILFMVLLIVFSYELFKKRIVINLKWIFCIPVQELIWNKSKNMFYLTIMRYIEKRFG